MERHHIWLHCDFDRDNDDHDDEYDVNNYVRL